MAIELDLHVSFGSTDNKISATELEARKITLGLLQLRYESYVKLSCFALRV